MTNSLLEDSFVQYKHDDYIMDEYYQEYNNIYNQVGTTVTKIIAPEPFIYNDFSISIEPTIQRLSNIKLPKLKEEKEQLCLQLVKDYGFLYFPRHLKAVNDDIALNKYVSIFKGSDNDFMYRNEYKGEKIDEWWTFISTLQYLIKKINDDNFYMKLRPDEKYFKNTQVELYLNEIKPSFDFKKNSILLKCDSLASACILSIVSDKKYLKSCLQCNKLFFAGRSDTKYCNTSCGKQYTRKLKENIKSI